MRGRETVSGWSTYEGLRPSPVFVWLIPREQWQLIRVRSCRAFKGSGYPSAQGGACGVRMQAPLHCFGPCWAHESPRRRKDWSRCELTFVHPIIAKLWGSRERKIFMDRETTACRYLGEMFQRSRPFYRSNRHVTAVLRTLYLTPYLLPHYSLCLCTKTINHRPLRASICSCTCRATPT